MEKKKQRHATKTGRNDPCPCGSEKKFKKCCLNKTTPETYSAVSVKPIPFSEAPPELLKAIQEQKVLDEQMIAQQGRGRPIISTEYRGRRLVEIGGEIFDAGESKTFHDVLPKYLLSILENEWIKVELKKELSERHPILQWHESMVKYQKENFKVPGKIQSVSMTGAMYALLGLAYNLYLLAHNSELQNRLINRLKHKDHFIGAHYEIYVAACFIKAGFEIVLEDEEDPTSSHCEFIATHKVSGRKFSLEAKARILGKKSATISNQLYNALKKDAAHERIIFIDINMPEQATDFQSTKWMQEASKDLRQAEIRLKVNGNPAPPAYVFLTNQPNHYDLENIGSGREILAEGYKIPDWKVDTSFSDLREAINSRDRHKEVFDLFDSLKEHNKIPATFDGEIPEFAFGGKALNDQRLIVGKKYIIPDENGKETVGTLLDPLVREENGKYIVYANYELQNGKQVLCKNELSESEIAAYKQHPDTFFGIYKQQKRVAKDPLDLYDFFYASFLNTSKEKLLELMKNYLNYDDLLNMSQEELAKLYCEGLTYHLINEGYFGQTN